MRRLMLAALILAVLLPSPVWAWGFRGHRIVNDGAVDIVPDPLHGFLARHRPGIVAHSVDPDLWAEKKVLTPPWTHFIDLDELDNAPFAGIPKDYASAAAKFGPEVLRKAGTLPWEIARRQEELIAAFRDARWDDVVRETAWIGHFIADSTMPLHATKDYQGRAAGNVVIPNDRGVNRNAHIRIESGLVEHDRRRFDSLRGKAQRVAYESDVLAETWATLRESYALVEPVLEADRAAYRTAPAFGAAFYSELERRAGDAVEARLARAQELVASAWLTAWENAGRPAPPEPRVTVSWPRVSARTPRAAKRAEEWPPVLVGLVVVLIVVSALVRRRGRRFAR